MAWRAGVPRMEASTHEAHEETTMPDLFDALSLIAASGVASERRTASRPSTGVDEDALELEPRRRDGPRLPERTRRTAVRRPRLLGWSR